ncbi:MAG: hypothetical protein ACRCTY_05975 [Candidatus Adiutrix sp.]
MTTDMNDPLHAPECMQEETQLLAGVCPKCNKELEFFTITELRNQGRCYHCKQTFDPSAFAAKLGISL